MIDRLPELKKVNILSYREQQNLNLTGQSMSDQQLNQENPYDQQNPEEKQGIDDQFIEEIKSVRQMIAALKNNNYRIQTIKGKYAKAIKSAQQHANSEQMNEILANNTNLHDKIKEKLAIISEKVKQAEENQTDEPETKMKKNFYMSLTKQVSDIIQKQQQHELEFKNAVKDKVTRQVRLIDKDITEQQMQEFIENPQLATEMLQKKIYGQASLTLKNTVNDIQDKFKDILKLEASVNKCVALFNQLAVLVQAQGQKIDSIEQNVAGAKDYVQKGEQKLQKAKQHHECSKKCMCIGIVVGLIVLIIIIVVIVVATKK